MFSTSSNTTGLVRVAERETFCNIDNMPLIQLRQERFSGERVNSYASTMNGPQFYT